MKDLSRWLQYAQQPGFLAGIGGGVVATALVAIVLVSLPQDDPDGSAAGTQSTASTGPGQLRLDPSPAPTVLGGPAMPPAATAAPNASKDSREDENDDDDRKPVTAPVQRFDGPAAPLPSAQEVSCPAATTTVGSASELTAALAGAKPGDSIAMRDGVYAGQFVAPASGTESAPIWLCGGQGAVLDGGGIKNGYALHLAPARYWRIVGFTVRNAQKGVMADSTRGTVIQGLTVEEIGDEAIHLRAFSTGSAVLRNTIRRTGLRREKFGEGVYIGSAKSNWSTYSDGEPDRSDNNLVHGNRISQTGSESVDVKEGTTGGVVSDNTFDGAGMTGADSWVDIKGNGWLITGNTGRNTPLDGFQTHEILDGWGTKNTFRGNTADVPPPGFGIALTPPRDNVVSCDNRTSSGGPATTKPACQT